MQGVMQKVDSKPAKPQTLNGLDPQAVRGVIASVAENAAEGITRWSVLTEWRGGARSRTHVSEYQIGRKRVEKDWDIDIDEPLELGGTNTRANPQEYLLAAVNACMIVTFNVLATLQGIKLDELSIETSGDIDLRGLFGLDDSVNPGYDTLSYTLRVRGDATAEQFEQIHQAMMKTSPNFANVTRAIALKTKMEVL